MGKIIERLRARLRRWLIGYNVENLTIEITMDAREAKRELLEFEAELDRILAKAERADAILKRFGR